ncbi:MAG TPA: hypothetical protein VFY60_12130, partial [Pyrinomonadaceae bacterium]|nr:hypothetical protein [Pyrinomonadaceae bacterium]
MRAIRKTIFMGFLAILVTAGAATTGFAQFGASNTTARDLVRRIQTRTDSLQRAVQNAADRNNYRVEDVERMIVNFESELNQLDRRLVSRRATSPSDVQPVLDRATQIDNFFSNNRLGAGSRREWQAIRTDLDQLASLYNVDAPWGGGTVGGGGTGTDDYNLSDAQMRQLIDRLNVRSAAFSRNLRQDLNRRNYDDRSSADEVRRELSEFETALVQLRNRVNSRRSTSSQARELLEHAAFLNSYIASRQLSYQTENNWTTLRQDLDRLASAFNIAWNWSNVPTVPGGGGVGRRDLTGTFRLNTSRGDDARRAIDDATRSLSSAERQRVQDSLLRRFDPPQM